MAIYHDIKYLVQTNTPAPFTKEYKPGEVPDHSGIYRCTGCGREVVAEHTRTLPPQNHHQHTTQQGDVRWKMIVYPQAEAK